MSAAPPELGTAVIGGRFDFANGVPLRHLCVWRDNDLVPFAPGNGVMGQIQQLLPIDRGQGPELVALGTFDRVGAVCSPRLAVWNEGWQGLVNGPFTGTVNAIAVFDGGDGPSLYAAGQFNEIGGVAAKNIARFDGAWHPLSSGTSGIVFALAVFTTSSGPSLYVGGDFDIAGGVAAKRLARWDGAAWFETGSFGTGSTEVRALAVYSGPTGAPNLYAGGKFAAVNGIAAPNLARFNGTSWSGFVTSPNGLVKNLDVLSGGADEGLYLRGSFDAIGAQPARFIARFANESFTTFNGGVTTGAGINDLVLHDDGNGRHVFVIGDFTQLGGGAAARIARWTGAQWQQLGAGLNGIGRALAAFDDGFGASLYAGGDFTQAGGSNHSGIAQWMAGAWADVHGDIPLVTSSGGTGTVRSLTVLPDSGAHTCSLYVGGEFVSAGGKPADSFARYRGCAPPDEPPLAADLDADGVVGALDLAILLSAWDSRGGAADLDHDGYVGSSDLAVLLSLWTP